MEANSSTATPAAISIESIKAAQNFPAAVITGIAVAIGGALLWAAVTVTTNYKLGLMAIAEGYLVGKSICAVGKGIDAKFGYLGALCSFLGCLIGNVLSMAAFYAHSRQIGIMDALSALDADKLVRALTHDPMDLLFYGIAIYEGYRFSFKYKLTKKTK